MISKKILLLFLIFYSFSAISQVKISIHVDQATDSMYYLTRYYGDKFQLVDTTFTDNEYITFEDETNHPAGIYLLVDSKKNRLMEFLLEEDQQFEIYSVQAENGNQLRCEGSVMTDLFFEQMHQTNLIYSRIQEQAKTEDSRPKIDSLLNELKAIKSEIIEQYPDSLLSKILLAMNEPEVPATLKQDQKAAYYYYKAHFWDDIDLSDDRLLRTPLIYNKLDQYFEQLVPQVSDSITMEIDSLIEQTNGNKKVRDYLIWHFTDQYQNPKIMGLDKVFIHMADTYFSQLEITNTSESVREKILSRADQIRNLTLGSPAPNLWLVDTSDSFRTFKDITTDYLVLFFWDHECGVCKKELKVLQELYHASDSLFEVFAISANADFPAWKNYIREHKLDWVNVNGMKSMTDDFHDLYDIYGTPVIYVLDSKRNIIAKRIKAEQISLVIAHDQKIK
ncbi:MAG: DUF5106 domain-containing protein [Bacteroidetes bacterium]|jgi:peroxiredoxin|nr:DUF5106 domain-containing protein [Bacteroidota bacterium]